MTIVPRLSISTLLAASLALAGCGEDEPATPAEETGNETTSQAMLATDTVASLNVVAASWIHGLAASPAIGPDHRDADSRFGRGADSRRDGETFDKDANGRPRAGEAGTTDEETASSDAAAAIRARMDSPNNPYDGCTTVEQSPTEVTVTYACTGPEYPAPLTGVIQAAISTELASRIPLVVATYTADVQFIDLTLGGVAIEGGMILVYVVSPELATMDIDFDLVHEQGTINVSGSLEVLPDESCPSTVGQLSLTLPDGDGVTVDASYDACGEGGCPSSDANVVIHRAGDTDPDSPGETRVDFDGRGGATETTPSDSRPLELECAS